MTVYVAEKICRLVAARLALEKEIRSGAGGNRELKEKKERLDEELQELLR